MTFQTWRKGFSNCVLKLLKLRCDVIILKCTIRIAQTTKAIVSCSFTWVVTFPARSPNTLPTNDSDKEHSETVFTLEFFMDTFVVENVLFQEVTVLLKLYITMSTIISVKHNVANVCKYRQRVLFRKTTILFSCEI